jgi:hypothetical protein
MTSRPKDDLPIHYIPDRKAAEEAHFANPETNEVDVPLDPRVAFREGFNACFRRLKNRVAP